MLLAEDGTLTDNFEKASPGNYVIYDVTGAARDSLLADGVDTGVSVSVADKDVEAAVDYYTVAFYDGAAEYGAGTPQAPQIVLKGKTAVRPADPSKEGYRFRQWTVEGNGNEPFNFHAGIGQKSNVYAGWIRETAAVHTIKATAGEGGSISTDGDVPVEDGTEQVFEIIPDNGWQIKAVLVDGEDRTGELTGSVAAGARLEIYSQDLYAPLCMVYAAPVWHKASAEGGAYPRGSNSQARPGEAGVQTEAGRYYTLRNVKEDHTIRVIFENKNGGGTGGSGTDDGTGSTGGSGDNSGPGSTGGSGDNGGTGSTGGSGDNGGTESTGGSGADGGPGSAGGSSAGAGAGNTGRSSKDSPDGGSKSASKDAEPKTGDTSHVEVYATLAMISGLAYLALYLRNRKKGAAEEE